MKGVGRLASAGRSYQAAFKPFTGGGRAPTTCANFLDRAAAGSGRDVTRARIHAVAGARLELAFHAARCYSLSVVR